jgi:hypothetical protein
VRFDRKDISRPRAPTGRAALECAPLSSHNEIERDIPLLKVETPIFSSYQQTQEAL